MSVKPRGRFLILKIRIYIGMLHSRFLTFRTRRRMQARGAQVGSNLFVRDRMPACINNGTMIIGDDVGIRGFDKKARLFTFPSAMLVIGDRTFINSGAQIFAFTAIHIGDDCLIGDDCMIFDTNFHGVHEDQAAQSRPISIGRNVWLGRGVTILPGVTIGDHSVIGACSVVTKDVPERQVWQGNPACYVKDVRASDGFRRRTHRQPQREN